jgi:hypothetical protein
LDLHLCADCSIFGIEIKSKLGVSRSVFLFLSPLCLLFTFPPTPSLFPLRSLPLHIPLSLPLTYTLYLPLTLFPSLPHSLSLSPSEPLSNVIPPIPKSKPIEKEKDKEREKERAPGSQGDVDAFLSRYSDMVVKVIVITIIIYYRTCFSILHILSAIYLFHFFHILVSFFCLL